MENMQQAASGARPGGDERGRWVMHLDMDAFFAAIEQRDNPAYRGRPVIVGARPGSRGVVATCSYEARVYGVRSAMPISMAARLCPSAIFLRPDGARYRAASEQVFAALREISPVVEPVSVDEAYVDISGLERLFGDPASIGATTRDRVAARVGLGCSVGIGPNRLVAKLASEHGKPGGLVVVPPAGVRAFLDPLPVSALRGVGPGLAQALERVGLHRVADLEGCSPERLQALFGTAAGASLHRQARGEGSDRVGAGGARKSISKETTFGRDTADPRRIRQALRWLASELGRALRREGLRGLQLTLKLRLAGFETHARRCAVRPAVDGDLEIFGHAWRLYRESGHAGRPVRLVGIGLARWEGEGLLPDLFDHTPERLRRDALYRTLDQVKERFGRGIIAFGAGEEWR